MFTGIVETLGVVKALENENSNLHITLESDITDQLKIDQSVAHNGVCLTVVKIDDRHYTVTAIKETLDKSNLHQLAIGNKVNLERCMEFGGRIDGHIVQGHVDTTGKIISIDNQNGSWVYTIEYDQEYGNLVIDKGSITVNGTSLTVVDPAIGKFSVAIIPYTYDHTIFHQLEVGSIVNLEFDILGKYISAHLQKMKLG